MLLKKDGKITHAEKRLYREHRRLKNSEKEDENRIEDQKRENPVTNWTVQDVGNWLAKKEFTDYIELFNQQKIDGAALLLITENDLKSFPLHIEILGDVKHILLAVEELKANSLVTQKKRSEIFHAQRRVRKCKRVNGSESSDLNVFSSDNNSGDDIASSEGLWTDQSSKHLKQVKLKPEFWKTLVAMLYLFTVTWLTAIVMVIVHDRVPDMQTYPPLPDIFLDNVPLIPWAFKMCEFTAVALMLLWISILFFHKHRFILLRRMCSLFGSVFLLRCITMIITSLSVPGRHLECKAKCYNSIWEKLHAAVLIWLGGGMSIHGVRTCGDYMFSGHTVALTLLNFFITEYSPRTMYYLHTFTWVLNLFGIFFILAGHEHYSIDVFIAFYISTRLFLYYHTLANNRALMQDDRRRTRIWFPLFYFFESGVDGIVPNEYEWPIQLPTSLQKWLNQLQ